MPTVRKLDHFQTLLAVAEAKRVAVTSRSSTEKRNELGQFFTPASIARLMAGLFDNFPDDIRILDAGAGIGALIAATVDEAVRRAHRPRSCHVIAYELHEEFTSDLRRLCESARDLCASAGIRFSYSVQNDDFIRSASNAIAGELFRGVAIQGINVVILNPPYAKLNSNSDERRVLREAGIETSNLYSAFVALAVKLLAPGGQLVAITPRSFCNGPYFKPFRLLLTSEMAFRRIHLFNSRAKAFQDDGVLQENIIFHMVKATKTPDTVEVSLGDGPDDHQLLRREVDYEAIVSRGDPDRFIHIETTEQDHQTAAMIRALPATLPSLGIEVSTGRVVDFRAREFLRKRPSSKTAPLIYATHFSAGLIEWPKPRSKKSNALCAVPRTGELLIPSGFYTLTKRFSSKEERRRVVAAVYDPTLVRAERVGFENHLNYFHRHGEGLPPDLSRGLAIFLNSTLVDGYFRQFNGHTQVNATDLRRLRYPSLENLIRLGAHFDEVRGSQQRIDALALTLLFRT